MKNDLSKENENQEDPENTVSDEQLEDRARGAGAGGGSVGEKVPVRIYYSHAEGDVGAGYPTAPAPSDE